MLASYPSHFSPATRCTTGVRSFSSSTRNMRMSRTAAANQGNCVDKSMTAAVHRTGPVSGWDDGGRGR